MRHLCVITLFLSIRILLFKSLGPERCFFYYVSSKVTVKKQVTHKKSNKCLLSWLSITSFKKFLFFQNGTIILSMLVLKRVTIHAVLMFTSTKKIKIKKEAHCLSVHTQEKLTVALKTQSFLAIRHVINFDPYWKLLWKHNSRLERFAEKRPLWREYIKKS